MYLPFELVLKRYLDLLHIVLFKKEETEASIIEKCLKQKPSGQKALYDRFFNYAMSVALRYCRSKDEAIEVVNDAFLKTFNSLHLYQSD